MKKSFSFISPNCRVSLSFDTLFSDSSICVSMQERREMSVQSLGEKDPCEEEMATHSSTLAGKFHRQTSLAGSNLWGHKESTQLSD